MGHIRRGMELEKARADKRFLLEQEYKGGKSPQALCIEIIYAAIESLLSMKKGDTEGSETRIQLLHLVSFAGKPDELGYLFGSESGEKTIRTINESVENALLHVVATASVDLKETAAEGLVKMGSERAGDILSAIARRESGKGATSAVASEAIARMRRNRRRKSGATRLHLPEHAAAARLRKSTQQ
jgi:hypothetical protein